MMQIISVYLIGLVFGLGIALSGMMNPAKVLNFFDVLGSWDPSLAFVMGGALTITFIGYRIIFRAEKPVLAMHFSLPKNNQIDIKLLSGAAIFGVGWGISGFCPGAALPALGTGRIDVLLFVMALTAGVFSAKMLIRKSA